MALSMANGEGLFGMAIQFSFKIRLHLGAMGRSHRGVDRMPLLSLAQFSGSAEAKSAWMYVRAASSGYGRGVHMVGFAHFSSLSSRK